MTTGILQTPVLIVAVYNELGQFYRDSIGITGSELRRTGPDLST